LQIGALTADIADYRLKAARDAEPEGLRDKKAKLESVRKSLAELRAPIARTVTEKMQEKSRRDRDANLVRVRNQIAADKQYETALREKIDSRNREVTVLSKGVAGLETIREEITQTEDVAKKAHARIQALEVELMAAP